MGAPSYTRGEAALHGLSATAVDQRGARGCSASCGMVADAGARRVGMRGRVQDAVSAGAQERLPGGRPDSHEQRDGGADRVSVAGGAALGWGTWAGGRGARDQRRCGHRPDPRAWLEGAAARCGRDDGDEGRDRRSVIAIAWARAVRCWCSVTWGLRWRCCRRWICWRFGDTSGLGGGRWMRCRAERTAPRSWTAAAGCDGRKRGAPGVSAAAPAASGNEMTLVPEKVRCRQATDRATWATAGGRDETGAGWSGAARRW
jgi:hypothetical protein